MKTQGFSESAHGQLVSTNVSHVLTVDQGKCPASSFTISLNPQHKYLSSLHTTGIATVTLNQKEDLFLTQPTIIVPNGTIGGQMAIMTDVTITSMGYERTSKSSLACMSELHPGDPNF
ncbi:conserved hypothetical protein [Ricinus communis]|uniref:Uncharacterized protein n=1 Tax=Ricinus communis TaxID=3988 RepID=B9RKY9_RICCO|nr:conserved hypothetical protein [Ricinus communis]